MTMSRSAIACELTVIVAGGAFFTLKFFIYFAIDSPEALNSYMNKEAGKYE